MLKGSFLKFHIIQSILKIQLYSFLLIGSVQLSGLCTKLKTKCDNNYIWTNTKRNINNEANMKILKVP